MVNDESHFYCHICRQLHKVETASVIFTTAWHTVQGELFRVGECKREGEGEKEMPLP